MKSFSALLCSLLFIIGRKSIVTNAQSVVCDDSYECEDQTLSITYAYCYGFYGCDTVDGSATYLYAYGYLSNYYTALTATYTYAYGFRALLYADDLLTQYLYAYGYQSAYYADIQPQSTALYTYFYGYYSGYYADVTCHSGDSCYIYCGDAYGCLGMSYYCYSGATCYYNCESQGVCPTLYGGIETSLTMVTGKFELNSDVNENNFEEIPAGLGSNDNYHYNTYFGLTDEEIREYYNENKKNKEQMMEKMDNKLAEFVDNEEMTDIAGMDDKAARRGLANSLKMAENNDSFIDKYLAKDYVFVLFIGMILGVFGLRLINFVMNKIGEKCRKSNEYEPLVNRNTAVDA